MINIDNKYNIGDVVYLITDRECSPRMIFAIIVYKYELTYKLCCGTLNSDRYDFELTSEKPVFID